MAVLLAICALVSRNLDPSDLARFGITSIEKLRELTSIFVSNSKRIIGARFDDMSIEVIQAGILLALVGIGNDALINSYMVIGIAHRSALELGLHWDLASMDIRVIFF